MRIEIKKLVYSALFATTLFLAGCADAGKDQTVRGSSLVTLDGNNSTACVGGEIKKYKWKQISGTHVEIDNNTNRRITFTAPSVESETVLEFRLKTVEKGGHPRRFRSYDWVKVTIQPNDTNDTTAPVITLNGENPMSLYVGETYIEAGARATDDVDGDVDVNITGEVNTSTPGRYTVTYSATDSANNVATAERSVTVIDPDDSNETNDTTAPVITLNGENPMSLYVGETYVEAGATAVDDIDGDLNVTITGGVDTNHTGSYLIAYTAMDSAGNVATTERTVHVIDSDDNVTGVKSISNNVSTEEDRATYNVEMYTASIEQTYPISITARDGESVISVPTFTSGVIYDSNQSTITVPVGIENFSLTLPLLDDNLSGPISDPFIVTIGGVSNSPIDNHGDIHLTTDWIVPENALFLDIREEWERIESRPVGAIGGAVYGSPNFVENVRSLTHNDKQKQLILICRSGSRTEEALEILSGEGFSNVWQIVGGMNQWEALKPNDVLSGPL